MPEYHNSGVDELSNRDALELLRTEPLKGLSPDWAAALAPVEAPLRTMGEFLNQEFSTAQHHDGGPGFLPAPRNVLRAFQQPLSEVKVLIVGQDPYPTLGHPVGLSFAVDRTPAHYRVASAISIGSCRTI